MLTTAPDAPTVIEPGSIDERKARASGVLVYETAHEATLHDSLNELDFYTWGDEACCLPRGATRATLAGNLEALEAGAFLVFQEVQSPTSTSDADADRTHRHVVRLTRVVAGEDPSGRLFEDPPVDGPVPVTHIEWDASDALPFALCISAPQKPRVSIALGNIVLADHGETIHEEDLGVVPAPPAPLRIAITSSASAVTHRHRSSVRRVTVRLLSEIPLTHGFNFADLLEPPPEAPQDFWSAAALRALDARNAAPQLAPVIGEREDESDEWFVQRDLLASDAARRATSRSKCATTAAQLRFGDGTHGRIPAEHTGFKATYRKGNGVAGNVGAGAITHRGAGAGAGDRGNNQSPAGIRRRRRRRHRSGAPRCAAGIPHTGARSNRRGLCRGRRAPCRGAARGGYVPLDRQLAHGVRHRRPRRRRGGR